jgi:hypothetical protein
MERTISKVLAFQSLLMIAGALLNVADAQEPKRLLVQKPQRLTSMTPSEDVTVGGMAQQVHSPAVISTLRPSQFLVPGWDSNNQKYLVLGRSANSHLAQKNQRDKAPVIERRPVEPYAYGWFGAKMNRHPHRSFGYQQAYTQWAFE